MGLQGLIKITIKYGPQMAGAIVVRNKICELEFHHFQLTAKLILERCEEAWDLESVNI